MGVKDNAGCCDRSEVEQEDDGRGTDLEPMFQTVHSQRRDLRKIKSERLGFLVFNKQKQPQRPSVIHYE